MKSVVQNDGYRIEPEGRGNRTSNDKRDCGKNGLGEPTERPNSMTIKLHSKGPNGARRITDAGPSKHLKADACNWRENAQSDRAARRKRSSRNVPGLGSFGRGRQRNGAFVKTKACSEGDWPTPRCTEPLRNAALIAQRRLATKDAGHGTKRIRRNTRKRHAVGKQRTRSISVPCGTPSTSGERLNSSSRTRSVTSMEIIETTLQRLQLRGEPN